MFTVTNCKSGELVIQAPQCEIEKFVAEAESAGLAVRRKGNPSQSSTTNSNLKPAPLGIPVMNFRKPEEKAQAPREEVANTVGRPKPLGIPTMKF